MTDITDTDRARDALYKAIARHQRVSGAMTSDGAHFRAGKVLNDTVNDFDDACRREAIAGVVAWLRKKQSEMPCQSDSAVEQMGFIADALERGEHRNEGYGS